MLLFAHTGIALGAAAAVSGAVNGRKDKWPWLISLSRFMDIRIFIIGAMLPDIIDKPIGVYLFRNTFDNGRIFAHTLIFLVLLTLTGWIIYRTKRRTWMLALAAGTLCHLALDEMWKVPSTLCWPLMGWKFTAIELGDYAGNMFNALFTNPFIIITETIGLVILAGFAVWVFRKKQAGAFIKTGRIT